MMVKKLNHIAMIVSSEKCITFYEKLGFKVIDFQDRVYDKLYFLESSEMVLEIFVDPTHPQRLDRPEAKGLRHLAFDVDSIEKTVETLQVEAEPIRESRSQKFTFVRDYDSNPIELREDISIQEI